MNKKLSLSVLLVMIGLLFVGVGNVTFAEEFANVAVTQLDTMQNWDTAIQVSYQKEFSLSEKANPEETIYLSFTLEQDSLVRVMQSIDFDNTGTFAFGASATKLYVYSDAGLANEIMQVATPSKSSGGLSTYRYMKAGTYYIKSTSKYGYGYSTKYTKKICIGAVAADKLLKTAVEINSTKNQATVSVDASAMGQTVDTLQYVSGAYTMDDISNSNIWKTSTSALATSYKATVSDNTAGFSVNKNGTYTVRVNVKYASDGQNNIQVCVPVTVSGLDNKKPVIKGVKAGKKYKKAVKITFSDKGSGIKKATLNGKKIKSGKTVKKKGSYTLKVTDKAGNISKVKFKIVK